MKVAVIDNGIAQGLLKCPVVYYSVEEGKVMPCESTVTVYSHGSRCALRIVHGIPNVQVVSIAVHPEFSDGTEGDLLAALKWCLEQPIDLINMSNGIISFFQNEAINEVCYQLWKRGTILVAAVSNDWKFTVPANLPYVLGVGTFSRCFWRMNPFSRADKTSIGLTIVRNRNGGISVREGNSFACARESHRILKKLSRGRCLSQAVSRQLTDFSLLKNVVIWGADGQKEWESNPGESITLVIEDENEIRKNLDRLKKLRNPVCLVIWCGKRAPGALRCWCRKQKIPLWEEPRWIGRPLRSSRRLAAVENFFVVIVRCDNDLPVDSLALKKAFATGSYHVLLFSDAPRSYLYGAFPFADQRNILRACAAVNPDIILVECRSELVPPCDICIVFCPEMVRLETEDRTEQWKRQEFEDIYSWIVKRVEAISRE